MQQCGDEKDHCDVGVAGHEGARGAAEDGVGEEAGGVFEVVLEVLVPEDSLWGKAVSGVARRRMCFGEGGG